MRIGKYLIISLAIFLLGGLGGIWAQAVLLPYLVVHPSFSDWEVLEQWSNRTLIVEQTEEYIITEQEGLYLAAQNAERVVVAVQSQGQGQVLSGSGFIYTTEGLVVTLASLVPQGYSVRVYLENATNPVQNVQVLKRDFQNNYALLKIDRDHLSTVSFADEQNIRAGMPVFLFGKVLETQPSFVVSTVNQGVIHSVRQGEYRTNIQEDSALQGAPLFDIEGRIIGVSSITEAGDVRVSSLSTLRSFLEQE